MGSENWRSGAIIYVSRLPPVHPVLSSAAKEATHSPVPEMEKPVADQTSSSLSSPKFIPSEILIDIITRLPSKSLIRFGTVSKFWYSFIRNPNFITTHLNRSLIPFNSCLLLMPAKFKYNGDDFLSYLFDATSIEHLRFEIPWSSNHQRFSKIGNEICFCNGVICFSSLDRASKQLYLCNPSIRKLKILPPSCIDAVSKEFHSVFGFGVDNVSGDYKVVRLFYDSSDPDVWPMVEVYSLRIGSWKRVELNFNVSHVQKPFFSSVFCNGAIHWFAGFYLDEPKAVLCFDLCDEVFREIELPVGLPALCRGYVFMFGESLSVFIEAFNWNLDDEGMRYEVWIMKEYGVVESWTKEFTGLVEGVHEAEVGFSKSGKVILRKMDGMLALLDLECGQLEDVGFNEKYYRVVDYMESLVLLDDGVSSQEQPQELLSHQTRGSPATSSSCKGVEEGGDASCRADAIRSSCGPSSPKMMMLIGEVPSVVLAPHPQMRFRSIEGEIWEPHPDITFFTPLSNDYHVSLSDSWYRICR